MRVPVFCCLSYTIRFIYPVDARRMRTQLRDHVHSKLLLDVGASGRFSAIREVTLKASAHGAKCKKELARLKHEFRNGDVRMDATSGDLYDNQFDTQNIMPQDDEIDRLWDEWEALERETARDEYHDFLEQQLEEHEHEYEDDEDDEDDDDDDDDELQMEYDDELGEYYYAPRIPDGQPHPLPEFVTQGIADRYWNDHGIHVGMEVEGTIKRVLSYGARVDIGIKKLAFLHVTEMLEEGVTAGQVLTVRIKSIHDFGRTVWVSCKEFDENRTPLELLNWNKEYNGKVVGVTKHGAYLDIGAQNFAFLSSKDIMRWSADFSNELDIGDKVSGVHIISLSLLKQRLRVRVGKTTRIKRTGGHFRGEKPKARYVWPKRRKRDKRKPR